MGDNERRLLTNKAVQLADLIVQAEPARIQFGSERQFRALMGLGSAVAVAPLQSGAKRGG